MKISRLLKWLALSIVTSCACLLVACALYDLLEFQPLRPEIEALLASAHPLERTPPAILPLLQDAKEGGRDPWVATRVILWEIDADRLHGHPLRRAAREVLWRGLLALHYSHADLLEVERAKSYFGRGAWGYAAGALSIYGRPLDQLDDIELATLVVITWWPSRNREAALAGEPESTAKALLTRARSLEAAEDL